MCGGKYTKLVPTVNNILLSFLRNILRKHVSKHDKFPKCDSALPKSYELHPRLLARWPKYRNQQFSPIWYNKQTGESGKLLWLRPRGFILVTSAVMGLGHNHTKSQPHGKLQKHLIYRAKLKQRWLFHFNKYKLCKIFLRCQVSS
jgi:hypothetical protein